MIVCAGGGDGGVLDGCGYYRWVGVCMLYQRLFSSPLKRISVLCSSRVGGFLFASCFL